ncbi:MAG: hypothetical protein M3P01_12945, partial [Actinomycetota bacterium]|nr:hypothetical protein [Actinomycetota bacterium]
MSDDDARAMFGLPPRIDDSDVAETARELLGGGSLQAVGSLDGEGEDDLGAVGMTEEEVTQEEVTTAAE